MNRGNVCVLLPTMNEERTVEDVVRDFHEHGFERVLVIDGGSTDSTCERAEAAGAEVVQQRGRGKGQAIRQAVNEEITAPVVLMADADGTYRAADASQMIAPIAEGRADHVIGNRFADIEPEAMTRLNQLGNRLTNGTFRLVHGRDLVDILSGYRAFTRDSFERYSLSADGFGIETELAVEAVKHGTAVEIVPITYRARPTDSETNLHPLKDGGRIFLTLYQLARTNNPLFYFGSVGVASLLSGLLVAAYVAAEWFLRDPSVSHEALAVVAASGILLGVQLILFGFLSDIVVAVNREQTRRLEELAAQLSNDSPTDAWREPEDDATTDSETVTDDADESASEVTVTGPEKGK